MWNSAQCYSVVCGEEKLLFTFTVFISQDIVTENKGIEADWAQIHSSQSVCYVLFQSRGELKGQLKGQYLGLVQNRAFAPPTFRYKEYYFIYCFSLEDYLLF